MVSKIEKGGESPILEMQADSSQSIDSNYEFIENDSLIRSKVAYYEFVVNFEISGNYNNYVKFKKGLSELKKIIVLSYSLTFSNVDITSPTAQSISSTLSP